MNIKQLGEFEFLRDEKTKNESNSINKSDIIGAILKSTKNWEIIFKEKILPLLKKYEGKLCREGEGKNVIDNTNKPLSNPGALLQKLLSMIKGDKVNNNNNNTNSNSENKNQTLNILDKENLIIKRYNDSNYWDTKNTISNDIKIENDKNETNKEIDEEEELLGIAKKLEQNEKSGKYKKIGTGVRNLPKIKFDNFKIKKNNLQMNITSNAEKIGGGEFSNQIEEKNEKILELPEDKKIAVTNKIKIQVSESGSNKLEFVNKFINKKNEENKDYNGIKNLKDDSGKELNNDDKKEEENKNYNDTNYWDVNPGKVLNKNEIEDCLKDLL